MRCSPTAPPSRTTSRTSPPSAARRHEKAVALAEGHKARGVDSAVEAFVRPTVKEMVNKEDGTR